MSIADQSSVASALSSCDSLDAQDDSINEDEFALLHGAGSQLAGAGVRKRALELAAQAEKDVILVQRAAEVEPSSGSASKTEDSASPSTSSGSVRTVVLLADASVEEFGPAANTLVRDEVAEEIAAAAEADEKGFESWLPSGVSAEQWAEAVTAAEERAAEEDAASIASAEVAAAQAAAAELVAAEVAAEDVAATVAAEVAEVEVAAAHAQQDVEEVPAALSKLGRKTEGALEYLSSLATSRLPDSHPKLLGALPVTLALLVLAAALTMLFLQAWGGMLFGSTRKQPPAVKGGNTTERPNPLQALRVLHLNLNSAGQSKTMGNLNGDTGS